MLIYAGFEVVEGETYLTTELTDRAIDFITRPQDQRHPFFLYLPYNAIHTPSKAPEKYLDRFPDDPHKAMLAPLEDDVGRLLDLLDELGISRTSMVLFIGDNGGDGAVGQRSVHRRHRRAHFRLPLVPRVFRCPLASAIIFSNWSSASTLARREWRAWTRYSSTSRQDQFVPGM
jgi:arylsulfatase A-like enzyme